MLRGLECLYNQDYMHEYLIKENLFLEAVQGDFDDTPSDYVSKVFSYFFLEVFQEDAEVTVAILELQPNHSAYQDGQVSFKTVYSIFQTRKALLTF